MKILVIGGTGHVGTHLIPMLVADGHQVVIASRGNKRLIEENAYKGARFVVCDAGKTESLEALSRAESFDAIVDFPGSAYNVWKVFRDKTKHIVACGSFWMFGKPEVVPTPELYQNPTPFDWAANRYAQIKEMLADSHEHKAEFTAIMASNICGPGKIPLDVRVDRTVENHLAAMRGETVYLPKGADCLICPCDAEDLAALFKLALYNRTASAGQIFNGAAEYAVTFTKFIKIYADIYGVEIPIEYVSWDEYTEKINPGMGNWWHLYAHMCPDITKAKTLLGYKPRYTPEETVQRAVNWMKENRMI